MKVIMDDMRFIDVKQLKTFLQGSQKVSLRVTTQSEKYACIQKTIRRLEYGKLKRSEKRTVIAYLKKLTGYKRSQLLSLIQRALVGELVKKEYERKAAYRLYTREDIKLLEETDKLHLRLNRMATTEILRREKEVFNHEKFCRLSTISPSHIDNLRKTIVYKTNWVNGTKPTVVAIGVTKKPEANNAPGSLRIDTCHQRDVYHIHAIDEITQWEIVICVPRISEA